ncbi:MAG TPA: OB-fold domain-containing protein [Candidatus Thermoplasmatota archaeon]|nr:OB-fold domain-containing protein [Candidatus Thermoplasmatota archaeon]
MTVAIGRCASGHAFAPPRKSCGACGKPLRKRRVPASGVVLSWTRVDVPPEGFRPGARVAVVRLDAGPSLLARARRAIDVGGRVAVRETPEGYEI